MRTAPELIKKYNQSGPRYTSYPPVPFWENSPTEVSWIQDIKANYNDQEGLDLYVHVPFCESLCWYCGCSRIITKNHDREKPFVEMVEKEWKLYEEKLGFSPKVNSVHLGGGTPTFLSPENLNKLLKTLLKNKTERFIGSIEIDPRTCSKEHLDVLEENSLTRISLGIQDFDPEVQKLINRFQDERLVTDLVSNIRERGFTSINFDLIYGLPGQTISSIEETIKIVKKLAPDLIAFYSYAHLPERIKNQRLIAEERLPDPELKRALYEFGKEALIENGYDEIGMDHFARKDSFLRVAKDSGKLKRNFMGYVDQKSSVLIGLGPTSISDSSISFMQNEKDVKAYETKVLSGKLPLTKGHKLSARDLMVGRIIQDLMCQGTVHLPEFDLPYWDEIMKDIDNFAQDGLIQLSQDNITVTEPGKPFIRNLAMSFDYRLRESQSKIKFSKTI